MAARKSTTQKSLKTNKRDTNLEIYSDPNKEYLVGGVLSYNVGLKSTVGGNALSFTKDDLMNDYGYQIYQQMYKDPEVYKCIKLLKVNSLQDGVEFQPCLSDNDPQYENAKLVSDFCTHAIRGLKKPLKDTLTQMLDALVYGHKIAEIVYKNELIEEFGGTFLTLDSIKPKPIGLARFVVDDSFNVLGIMGTNKILSDGVPNVSVSEIEPIQNKNIYSRGNKTYIKSADGVENIFLNVDKFMVLTIDPEDEDPRGRSILRPAFTFWNLKQQIIPELLRFILTCSIPLLIGFTPEDQEGSAPPYKRDEAGNIIRDTAGRPIIINREAAMRDALMYARNATSLALKGGSKVTEIGGKGTGLPFYKTIELCDSQIEKAMLLQTLATSEGRYSSRAQSQTHMDTLENLIWDIKKLVVDMVSYYLLKPLIKYNFGKAYLKYMPVVSLGDIERRNFSLDGATVATLYASGYIAEDQKRFTDQMLGIPVRDSSYNPFRNITPDEAIRYSDAVLQQVQLEADIKKTREASNLERVQQIVGLQKALETISDAGVRKAINDYTTLVLADIENDKLDNDETRILETLTSIGMRTQKVLNTKQNALGDIESLDADKIVDTTIQPAKPVSGDGTSVPQPYISTKGAGKPATFSKRSRKR